MVAPIVGAGLVLVRLVGGQIVKYTYKKGTKSAKAFQEAFKKAVNNNQKTFTFEGRVYSTDKK